MSPRFICLFLSVCLGTFAAYANCDDRGIETLPQCSDVVLLGRVLRSESEDTNGAKHDFVYTTHIVKVESYYAGSGAEEIRLLTPGGMWTDPNGRQIYTSIVGARHPGWPVTPRVGDEFLAFLEKYAEGYRFVSSCHAAMPVQQDMDGSRYVLVPLRNKQYLQGAALAEYEDAEAKTRSAQQEEVEEAWRRLHRTFIQRVPVGQLADVITPVVAGEGGLKPANRICH